MDISKIRGYLSFYCYRRKQFDKGKEGKVYIHLAYGGR